MRKRMKEDMQVKTKCRTIQNDKWERKQHIKKCESKTRDYFRNCGQHPEDTKKWHFFTTKKLKRAPLI